MDGVGFRINSVDQMVLNIDAPGIQTFQVSDEIFEIGRINSGDINLITAVEI